MPKDIRITKGTTYQDTVQYFDTSKRYEINAITYGSKTIVLFGNATSDLSDGDQIEIKDNHGDVNGLYTINGTPSFSVNKTTIIVDQAIDSDAVNNGTVNKKNPLDMSAWSDPVSKVLDGPGGTVLATFTIAWVDQTIGKFTRTLAAATTAAFDFTTAFHYVKATDGSGNVPDERVLTGNVRLETVFDA